MDNDFSNLLRKDVPPAQLELIHRIAVQASTLGYPAYIVGGFVRDLLLSHPGLDFDLVIEGDAISLAGTLASQYGGKTTLHEKFRTAKWFLEGQSSVDLISARSETYKHPGALPTVKSGSLRDDLLRRDFTLNTLAIRLDGNHFGELHDELGGLDDLRHGVIRVLHPHSFLDDPTRMYRAVRYEKRYDFKIVKETLALVPEARGLIRSLSAQRIRHELDLILDESQAAGMIAGLGKLDLLSPIHPALRFDRPTQVRIETAAHEATEVLSNLNLRELRWILWLMTLPAKEIASVNKRLHFTASLLKSLMASSKLLSDLPTLARLKPSQCVEKLGKVPLAAIGSVLIAAPPGVPKQMLENYLSSWRHIKPKTTGHDLRKLGLEPGPQYQSILRKLRGAWLDGMVKNASEEREMLIKIMG